MRLASKGGVDLSTATFVITSNDQQYGVRGKLRARDLQRVGKRA